MLIHSGRFKNLKKYDSDLDANLFVGLGNFGVRKVWSLTYCLEFSQALSLSSVTAVGKSSHGPTP